MNTFFATVNQLEVPFYDFPKSPILVLGFFGILVAMVTVYTVNKAYFNSPFNPDNQKRSWSHKRDQHLLNLSKDGESIIMSITKSLPKTFTMLTSQLLNSSHSYMISTDSQKRTTKWNLQKTKLNTLKSVFHSIMKWTLTSKNTLLTLTHNAVKN